MQYHFNIKRKIFHFIGIIIPIIFFYQVFDICSANCFMDHTRSMLFYGLSLISFALLLFDVLRLRYQSLQTFFIRLAKPLLKNQEYNKMHSSIPYMFGNTILVGFFPREIAILSMLFLLIGDPMAAFIGSKYGRIQICNGRTLEGSIAGATAGILFGFIFMILITIFSKSSIPLWSNNEINLGICLIVLTGACTAFLLEAISTRGILLDDNFLIPVGSALVMLFVSYIQKNEIYFYPIKKLLFPIIG